MSETELQAMATGYAFVTPESISLWHWTDRGHFTIITERIGTEEGFADFSTGACGRGLYTSCSAVDLIDRGDEVIHLHLMTASKLLMIDPEVFGVGFPELFEMALHRLSYHWIPPDSEQNRRLAKAFAAPE